jgi:hypothetical protein
VWEFILAKRHLFYFALRDNRAAAGHALEALQSGIVDNLVVIHAGADLPSPFAECAAPPHKLQDLICQRNAAWMGDAMRNVCHELVRVTGPDDTIMLMSSDVVSGEEYCSGTAGWDRVGCELFFNSFVDNTFSRSPPKFGGFEGLMLKGNVLRDEKFVKFWTNLAPGMEPGVDRLFAQHCFHKIFSAKFKANACPPVSAAKRAISLEGMVARPVVSAKQKRVAPPANAGPPHLRGAWRPEQTAVAEKA